MTNLGFAGVLNRHESLASVLGAKLNGPRMLKGIDGFFEGTINTNPPQSMFTPNTVTWLDVVEFAKSKPNDFVLTTLPNGTRGCQFHLKGFQVEIIEDDWRLIVSGSMDGMCQAAMQPLAEDEKIELATLEILDQRLQVLIKKADEVARRARQLNYHLSGRRVAIAGRHSPQQPSNMVSGFQAVNQFGRSGGTTPAYDLHADLIRQFQALPQHSSLRLSSVGSIPPTPVTLPTAVSTPRTSVQQQVMTSNGDRPSPGHQSEPAHRDSEDEYRALVTARIERLPKGAAIEPPCDRCRRLKTPCTKQLTACQGCTRKHARCTWRQLSEDDIASLKGENGEGSSASDEYREPGFSGHRSTGSQSDYGVPRTDVERVEENGIGRPSSRIAISRHTDDIWRKGPVATPLRPDAMEMDVDPRDTRGLPHAVEMEGHREDRRKEHSMLSHMASIASAAVDASTAPHGSPRSPSSGLRHPLQLREL